ncbi:MAG TPA: hypothetical protein V6C58_21505 [Allocoleopsis sp.]
MLNQLRSVYPHACLITELVSMKHYRYVVRAMIQVEGTTIATAMSVAEKLELAEDQAQKRLLTILGIDLVAQPNIVPETMSINLTPDFNTTSTLPEINIPVHPVSQSHQIPSLPQIPALIIEEPTPVREEVTVNVDAHLPPIIEIPPVPSKKSSGDRPLNKLETTPRAAEIPEVVDSKLEDLPLVKEKIEPVPVSKSDPPTEIKNNAELIADTTIEIKRLRWNNAKGREYLMNQYGKGARSELTDEELLDFLHYLKSLPDPVHS